MSMTKLGTDHIARNLYRNDRVHTAVPHPDAITDEHLRQYAEQGFLAIENVFTPSEVDAAKAGISALIAGDNNKDVVEFEKGVDVTGMSVEEREKYVRKIMWFVDREPRLKAMSSHPKLVGLVERIVGTTVNMIQDMTLLKPAHVGREKPWHQDDAYFALEPLDMILGTWTALDEATPENGCMHVIPGSHRKGARPHFHDRDCQLPDSDIEVEQDVVVPLKPGGTMLFSGLLHHGTPPNRSPAGRRALQFHYASTWCRTISPDKHGSYFHDAKGIATCVGMTPRQIADRFF
jgi:phytanoyl-CoA hydroxylase